MGAIGEGGTRVLEHDVCTRWHVPTRSSRRSRHRERLELRTARRRFAGRAYARVVAGSDGDRWSTTALATGSTARAAIAVARAAGCDVSGPRGAGRAADHGGGAAHRSPTPWCASRRRRRSPPSGSGTATSRRRPTTRSCGSSTSSGVERACACGRRSRSPVRHHSVLRRRPPHSRRRPARSRSRRPRRAARRGRTRPRGTRSSAPAPARARPPAPRARRSPPRSTPDRRAGRRGGRRSPAEISTHVGANARRPGATTSSSAASATSPVAPGGQREVDGEPARRGRRRSRRRGPVPGYAGYWCVDTNSTSRVVPEDVLRAVAVVHVPVDDQHPLAARRERGGGDRRRC